MKKNFQFSTPFFTTQATLNGLQYKWDEIRPSIVFRNRYRATFNLWKVTNVDFKLQITITRNSIADLEKAIIEFIA